MGSAARGTSARHSQASALIGDANAVEQVVRNGRGAMPPIGKDWEDRQMLALTDFLKEGGLSGG